MGDSLTLGTLVDCVLPGLIGVFFALLGYRHLNIVPQHAQPPRVHLLPVHGHL